MAFLNDHYLKLKAGYLFPEIGRRVKAFCEANPDAARRVIRCGIGDVTAPLPPAVIAALHNAVDEMGVRESFHGYGPEQGYEWLRAAIAKNDFRDRGLDVGKRRPFGLLRVGDDLEQALPQGGLVRVAATRAGANHFLAVGLHDRYVDCIHRCAAHHTDRSVTLAHSVLVTLLR